MTLTSADLANIRSNFTSTKSLPDPTSIVSSVTSGLTSKINDPIGSVLMTTLSSINSLSATISAKLDELQKNIIESVDSTSSVKLINNKIVVVVQPEDASKLPMYQATIQSKVDSARSALNKLNVVATSLNIVSQTASTLKTAMDVQEALLTVGNPVARATMTLLKKALKILNYKDVLNSYVSILSTQVANTNKIVRDLTIKLDNISVEFTIGKDLNSGVVTSKDEAKSIIRNTSLSKDGSNIPQDYTSNSGRNYILTVEPYGTSEIIARGRDKVSGLLVSETAPSFISSPDQLLEELKTILNQ